MTYALIAIGCLYVIQDRFRMSCRMPEYRP